MPIRDKTVRVKLCQGILCSGLSKQASLYVTPCLFTRSVLPAVTMAPRRYRQCGEEGTSQTGHGFKRFFGISPPHQGPSRDCMWHQPVLIRGPRMTSGLGLVVAQSCYAWHFRLAPEFHGNVPISHKCRPRGLRHPGIRRHGYKLGRGYSYHRVLSGLG